MTRKSVIGLVMVLVVLMTGVWAIAAQDTPAPAPAPGKGYGPWGGRGGPQMPMDEATIKLRGQLYQKHLEMQALLAAPQVDEAKASALQGEISKLRSELAQKHMAAVLDFKKKNPDWQPGGSGCPMGGPHGGGRMGWGGGGMGWGGGGMGMGMGMHQGMSAF